MDKTETTIDSKFLNNLGEEIIYRLKHLSLKRDWNITHRIDNLNFQFIIETKRKDGESYRILSPSYDPRDLEKLGIIGLINDAVNLVFAHYYKSENI